MIPNVPCCWTGLLNISMDPNISVLSFSLVLNICFLIFSRFNKEKKLSAAGIVKAIPSSAITHFHIIFFQEIAPLIGSALWPLVRVNYNFIYWFLIPDSHRHCFHNEVIFNLWRHLPTHDFSWKKVSNCIQV